MDAPVSGFKAFRLHYPNGINIVVAHDIDRGFTRTVDGLAVRFEGLSGLKRAVESVESKPRT